MQTLIDNLGLMELNELTVIVRLLLALLCGGILGFERMRKRRAAGLRTYMLVCIGSSIISMTAQFVAEHFEGVDVSRMPSQIIVGIGFLGAGTIMVTRYYRVKGLTTAAGLWVTAGVGLAIGIGFYLGALLTALVLILVLAFADKIENAYAKTLHRMQLYVLFQDLESIKTFINRVEDKKMKLSDLELAPSEGYQGVGLFCLLRMPGDCSKEEALDIISQFEGVLFVEEIEN
ncbi:MAG TPA: MgtC/SapB family protein [Fastidiosipila sp.]|jgi:putative Mg2+ transporter-C (MgtC) family protein|nr:MgtC/SapB family protein [Fastidiosipila sp.]